MTSKSRYVPVADWAVALTFVFVNVLAKGAFLRINLGEYTDGILQLQALKTRAGFYPPLYEILSRAVVLTGFSLEDSARIVSVVAAAGCAGIVYKMGRQLGGGRSAGIFAGLLYTLSPMPWRWSVRVMTDCLFLLFSTGTLVCLCDAWEVCRGSLAAALAPEGFDSAGGRRAATLLFYATLLTGLAGFTRYQGILLAPLLLIVIFVYVRKFHRLPWRTIITAVLFAGASVGWMMINRQVHGSQFASRTASTPASTALAWINTLESFVLISPYYLGYPVFAGALVGLVFVRRRAEPYVLLPAAVLWMLFAVMLLCLHAAFGSFQYRYMMPLVPIVCALAGVGFAAAEQWCAGDGTSESAAPGPVGRWRAVAFRAALLVSILYLAGFGIAVLVLQRETFGDQRAAADFLRAEIPKTTPIFSNERYGPHVALGSVKLSYWSGRPVNVLVSPNQPLPAGAVLVLGTAYGGNDAVAMTMNALEARYTLRPLTPAPFRSVIVPLMDDIMLNPLFNQNPLAWVMRYVPQTFATQVYVVEPRSSLPGPPSGA